MFLHKPKKKIKKPKPLKRTGIKKRSNTEKEDLEECLDDLWRDEVKARAGKKCEYCGKSISLNSHHIIGRRNKSTRWLLDNGVCLCAYHHALSSMFSAHQTPTIFYDWLIRRRGQDQMNKLNLQAQYICKRTFNDLVLLKFEFEKRIGQLLTRGKYER